MNHEDESSLEWNKRLETLKAKLNRGIEAEEKLEQNMKFIKKNEFIWNNVNITDQSEGNYIPLPCSYHRQFIKMVQLVLEFYRDLDAYKAAGDKCNISRMKKLLKDVETSYRNNWQIIQELYSLFGELQNKDKEIKAKYAGLLLQNEEHNTHVL